MWRAERAQVNRRSDRRLRSQESRANVKAPIPADVGPLLVEDEARRVCRSGLTLWRRYVLQVSLSAVAPVEMSFAEGTDPAIAVTRPALALAGSPARPEGVSEL